MEGPSESNFRLNDHRDMVYQVQFDHSGRRLAMCSSDMHVSVWDRGTDGQFYKSASWKVHGGAIWRVTWAHPEFGQILATSSNDRSVYIWEENILEGRMRWSKKAYLTDSRHTVTDIRFAPRQLGLMLATCSSQGTLRVYEAVDLTDISRWSLVHENQAFYDARASCLSWSLNHLLRPLLSVATDDVRLKGDERLVLLELNENHRRWELLPRTSISISHPVTDMKFSPNTAITGHQLAVAAQDVLIFLIDMDCPSYSITRSAVLGDIKKSWRLSWNVIGNMLTVTSGDGTLRVWKLIFVNQWKLVSSKNPEEYCAEMADAPRAMALSPSKYPFLSKPVVYY